MHVRYVPLLSCSEAWLFFGHFLFIRRVIYATLCSLTESFLFPCCYFFLFYLAANTWNNDDNKGPGPELTYEQQIRIKELEDRDSNNIDRYLDEIGNGMDVLEGIVHCKQEEVQLQTEALNRIEEKQEKATKRMGKIHKRLNRTNGHFQKKYGV